jgi:ATP/maltotriose-dependent transcriptional regulator MalT
LRLQLFWSERNLESVLTALSQALADSPASDRIDDITRAPETVAARLIEAVDTVVIEDLHHADEDPSVAKFIAQLVGLTHHRIKWIISSRTRCYLPLASWVTYGLLDATIDGNVLALTREELEQAAAIARVPLEPADLDLIMAQTYGWPAAIGVILRSAARGRSIQAIESLVAEMMARFLDEQVFDHLEDDEKTLLICSALISPLHDDLIAKLGIPNANRRFTGVADRLLFLTRHGVFAWDIHPLFRSFLQYTFTVLDASTRERITMRAAQALLACNRSVDALYICVNHGLFDESVEIIREYLFYWFAQGLLPVAEAAIESLPEDDKASTPAVLAARACLRWSDDNLKESHTLFAQAFRLSKEPLEKHRILRAKALLNLHSPDRADIQTLRSDFIGQQLLPMERCLTLTVLAAIAASSGDFKQSDQDLAQALALVSDVVQPGQRADIAYRFAVAFFLRGQLDDARYYAKQATALASNAYPRTASLANRLNAAIYLDDTLDVTLARAYTVDALAYARVAGDRCAYRDALYMDMDVALFAGDVARISELFGELREYRRSQRHLLTDHHGRITLALAEHRYSAISPFRDLRNLPENDRRPLFCAYNAAIGVLSNHSESRVIIDEAREHLDMLSRRALENPTLGSISFTTQCSLARMIVGILMAIDGREALAQRYIQAVILKHGSATLETAHELTLALMDRLYVASPSDSLDRLLATVETQNLGIGIVFRALVNYLNRRAQASNDLTESEVLVLMSLADGRRPKEIAAERERSINTVNSQIRSIYRKLDASSQTEAISSARKRGIL